MKRSSGMGDQELLEGLRLLAAEKEEKRKRDPRHTAKKSDLWLVLEGDWGGQIYLTIPWDQIGPKARIKTLHRELDAIAWPSNDGGALWDLYDPVELDGKPEDGYGGGMGGGKLEDALWMHSEFDEKVRARARKLLDL